MVQSWMCIMACTFPPIRLLTPSGSLLAFSSARVRVSHLPAASLSNRSSGLISDSMSQPTCSSTTDPNTRSSQNNAPPQPENADVVIQYVVLRRDLIDTWPLGSLVTQGCHASVSAVWSNKDDPFTIDYCSPDKIDSMHKVRLLLFLPMSEIQNFDYRNPFFFFCSF